LNWLALPTWARAIVTFLLMDYAYWWWHWANHMIPLFWRFHNVHHTDLDLDVSTAARFHFGEMVFSIGFLALAVVAFGISPIMLLVFFLCLEVATLFHHSNWRLPIRLERILNSIVVTPRMHGIHQSILQPEIAWYQPRRLLRNLRSSLSSGEKMRHPSSVRFPNRRPGIAITSQPGAARTPPTTNEIPTNVTAANAPFPPPTMGNPVAPIKYSVTSNPFATIAPSPEPNGRICSEIVV